MKPKTKTNKKTKLKTKYYHDPMRRLWTDNPVLMQDLLNILSFYGGITGEDMEEIKGTDEKKIASIVDKIISRSGKDSSILNQKILERFQEEAIYQEAPEWFVDIFTAPPMDNSVPNLPMAPSVLNDETSRELTAMLQQPLRNLGLSQEDADRISLELINSIASKELEAVSNADDWEKAIKQNTTNLVNEISTVLQEGLNKLKGKVNGSFKVI